MFFVIVHNVFIQGVLGLKFSQLRKEKAMKTLWFLMISFVATTSACSGDDASDVPQASVGGSAGASATGGNSTAGSTSQATGGASESAGTTSIAGSSSTGGTTADTTGSDSAGASSTTGGTSSATGGASSGGETSALAGASSTGGSTPSGILNCASTLKGAVELVPVVLKHRPEYSGMSATFYAACGETSASITSWGILCPKASCDPECSCMTYVPSKYALRFNIDRGALAWAVGSLGNTSALCPDNYDATTGCLGKEDLVRHGFTFANDGLMSVDNAEKNPQNNGYNYLYKVP